jgi:hypothetical protein
MPIGWMIVAFLLYFPLMAFLERLADKQKEK